MFSVSQMGLQQRKRDITNIQCIHSKVIGNFYENWEDYWILENLDDPIRCNSEIKIQTFLESKEFLAALKTEEVVTLLFTVGPKQKFPMCSNINCSKQTKCLCYRKYKGILTENDDSADHYWDKRVREKPHLIQHFLDEYPEHDRNLKFGHNHSKINYPLKYDERLQKKFEERLKGTFDLPESIVPMSVGKKCVHGNQFNLDDSYLHLKTSTITIYTYKTLKISYFSRPTDGECNCVDQADTHELLLWNLGSGKFVDYLFLHNHLHRMVTSGIAMNATIAARQSALKNCGVETTLTYSQFVRACTGYVQMVQFSNDAFLCPNCGASPKYIVCDGKTDGPTKRKVDHLQELDSPSDDNNYLSQGSFFNDRVFLPSKPERDLVCSLLTNAISVDDFLDSDVISSGNGALVEDLVRRIDGNWPGEIPSPYTRLIGNVCKISSVAGYLQILTPESLEYLEDFCNQNLELRSARNLQKQKCVAKEMPALWPNLVAILNLENVNFLPDDVANIVLKLISIRRDTFDNAAERTQEDYIAWENPEEEHATQFYPNWRLWRYPKKYLVGNTPDCDFCVKDFNKHRDFSFGIFSAGCACPLNITYGFEIMLCRESAHNLFRLLMCRDVDLHELDGVIFDFACGLDQYILNREPREFEYLRCLVDGAHWQGQKKLKKPDKSGIGGHIGCSEGYTFNLYKQHLPYAQPNSQGREQMHSRLQKLCPSLKQMDYADFMAFAKFFLP